MLVSRTAKDERLQELKEDFSAKAPKIIDTKVGTYCATRSWSLARETARLCTDRNVVKLLPADEIKKLKKLDDTIDISQDEHLYDLVLKARPQCATQIKHYLDNAPLKTMAKEVSDYRTYLKKLDNPVQLALDLDITWGSTFETMFLKDAE